MQAPCTKHARYAAVMRNHVFVTNRKQVSNEDGSHWSLFWYDAGSDQTPTVGNKQCPKSVPPTPDMSHVRLFFDAAKEVAQDTDVCAVPNNFRAQTTSDVNKVLARIPGRRNELRIIYKEEQVQGAEGKQVLRNRKFIQICEMVMAVLPGLQPQPPPRQRLHYTLTTTSTDCIVQCDMVVHQDKFEKQAKEAIVGMSGLSRQDKEFDA